jgi:Tfp pilus assembly protein PilZ
MQGKIGTAGQIINFNYVHEFIAQNLNKILYSTFTPGVLKLVLSDFSVITTKVEILEFSGLIRPYNKNFIVKVDTMNTITVLTDSTKPYLVARMDWITPPDGYDYETATYGVSGYSGYFEDTAISCESFDPVGDKIISTDHKLVIGDVIRFSATVGGVTKDVDYYVVNTDSNSFQISTTAGGTVLDIISTLSITNTYRKMNSHIVRFDMVAENDINPDYDVILVKLDFGPGGAKVVLNYAEQTQVYLNDYCINYNLVQRSGVRTLEGTNTDYIGILGFSGTSGIYDSTDETIERHVGHASGHIPWSEVSGYTPVMNYGLNAQYVNGITVSNADNSIGLKNNILSKNMVAARLFLNGFEYAIGQSGVTTYSGFSGYTGISGWSGVSGYSAYSGYLPLNNAVLQTSLNAEYFGGYKISDFTPAGHTHNLDEIADGVSYIRMRGVDVDGLVTTDGLTDGALEYRHQSISVPFRYDGATEKKMFALAGEIMKNGSTTVAFRKTFTSAPRVFILNNESDEWKAVDEVSITTTGFVIHHHENTSGTSLVADTTLFRTHWIAIGELS